MDQNKLSYYASFVVFACGLLIILLQFFTGLAINFKTFIGLIFLAVGILGIWAFKSKK